MTNINIKSFIFRLVFIVQFLTFSILPAQALDTDIYALNPRPNVAILFDTSGSMMIGVYESGVDYKNVYASACRQTFDGKLPHDKDNGGGDGPGTNNHNYKQFILPDGRFADLDPDEILLIKGDIGVSVTQKDGRAITMVGDTGYFTANWDYDNIERTGTKIVDGNLETIAGLTPTLKTEGAEQTIYLFNRELPLDRGINLHHFKDLPDGTQVDNGFAGTMSAPGMYFTGYHSINPLEAAEDGDQYVYFLITANRLYMLMASQLFDAAYSSFHHDFYTAADHAILENYDVTLYDTGGGSGTGGEVWSDLVHLSTPITSHRKFGAKNYRDRGGEIGRGNFTQPDAEKFQLHFVKLDLYDGNTRDYIKILDKETNTYLGKITCTSNSDTPFYSAAFTPTGSSVRGLRIHFVTDSRWWQTTGAGFKIDGYRYTTRSSGTTTETYRMLTRIDAVRKAILAVIDDTRGEVNWALAGFNRNDGADIKQPFNPGAANDDAVRQNIIVQLNKMTAYGGTPLGEALQDIFNHFHRKQRDFSPCSKQFTILISDGFPSADTDWNRLDSNVTIHDEDGDGWTADPVSYTNPASNYLDDVARYMYTHVFRNNGFGSVISDPAESFDNIVTHTLGFAQDLPLLSDTATDGGGIALTAQSDPQLFNALFPLVLLAITNASYVAPFISVDTANKTQNGEWLYMAFFKPESERWIGNLKKYRLTQKVKDGNCPGRTKEEWVVTDAMEADALECDGQFRDSAKSYWSTVVDGGDVSKGGVGEKLYRTVKEAFTSHTYYTKRHIYVLRNEDGNRFPPPVEFTPDNISNEDLGVDSDLERYRIINYIYGYTYAADSSAGYKPVAYRNWPLGSFIHSTPTLICYENDSPPSTYIVIGGNDGMLHVFADDSGEETAAFIPEDLLPRLQELNTDKSSANYKTSPLFYVDGQTTLYQEFADNGKVLPQQLIFGLRRGGSSYYSLDIENSDPKLWTVKWHITANGDFSAMGQSWSKMELMRIRTDAESTTVAGVFGGGYDTAYDDPSTSESSDSSKPGAAIYVIDILDSDASGISVLKKAVHTSTNQMDYAIPAEPSIVPNKYGYLDSIYFCDLGGQIWNLDYDNENYCFASNARLVFKSNPGSSSSSGDKDGGTLIRRDTGRRMFYSPTVTLMGGCNYRYSNRDGNPCDYTDLDDNNGIGSEDCAWTTRDAKTYVLIVGTGDRVHPNRKDINNRIYMILDTEKGKNNSSPLDETDLFNVTMDDIDVNNTRITENEKNSMRNYLSTTNGWFIKLEDIDDTSDYAEPVHHDGEKILSHPVIFNGAAYIPSFTPIVDDECHPKGEAKIYALNYCDGTAAVNFFKGNDDLSGTNPVAQYDYRDRYKTIGESIPSNPKVIIRKGKPEIFVSVGGGLPTIESKLGLKPIKIIYWRELRN